MDIIVLPIGVSAAINRPRLFEQCILTSAAPPAPPPGGDPVDPGGGIPTPVPPGVTYESLTEISEIVDTSPSQLIGCVNDTTPNAQSRLEWEFPDAAEEDGVVDRFTNDMWVLRGGSWVNVGPTPGPTIVTTTVLPPWNETVLLTGQTRTGISVEALGYALEIETTLDPLTTKTKATVVRFTPVEVPPIGVDITAATPLASTGAPVKPPAIQVEPAFAAPAGGGGAAVTTGTIEVETTLGGVIAPRPELLIAVGVVAAEAETFAPSIATGASTAVPPIDVDVTTVAPKAGGILREAFDLTLLVEDDLLNLNI